MKFRNYLEAITGIGIYPLMSLMLFVVFFGLVILYVVKGNKQHFEKLSNLPVNEKNEL